MFATAAAFVVSVSVVLLRFGCVGATRRRTRRARLAAGRASRPNRPTVRPAAALAQPRPADLALPALVVAEVRARSAAPARRAAEEVARPAAPARCRRARRARRAVSGRRGEHRVDVEAVAARPDQREQRVEPGGAEDRPVPVADPHACRRRRAGSCRRGRRCARRCRRRSTSAKRAGQRGGLVEVRAGRAGWPATWSQNADQVGELVGEGVEREPVGRRGELGGHDLAARPGRRPGRRAARAARGAGPSTYSSPSTTQSSS